jgi:deazaflavin-dependent oxidoreductase (nitroreductase family)
MADAIRSHPNPTVPRWINRLVIWLLRSPFHRLLSRNTLLLTIKGRKSGKPYTLPLSYIRDGDTITCCTDASWWRNLRGGAAVKVQIDGQERQGYATVIAGEPKIVAHYVRELLRRVPRDARFYGVRLNHNGEPNHDDIARVAREVVIVRVRLR